MPFPRVVPLIQAVEEGNEESVKYLLSNGADVEEKGPDGKNALQVCRCTIEAKKFA